MVVAVTQQAVMKILQLAKILYLVPSRPMAVVMVVVKINLALLVVRVAVVVVDPMMPLQLVPELLAKAMLAQPAFNLIEAVVAVALAPPAAT
jgi:hypothetical protein